MCRIEMAGGMRVQVKKREDVTPVVTLDGDCQETCLREFLISKAYGTK